MYDFWVWGPTWQIYPYKRKNSKIKAGLSPRRQSGGYSLDEMAYVVLRAAVIDEVTVLPETHESQSHFRNSSYILTALCLSTIIYRATGFFKLFGNWTEGSVLASTHTPCCYSRSHKMFLGLSLGKGILVLFGFYLLLFCFIETRFLCLVLAILKLAL